MASTKAYLTYILEQLSGLDDVRCCALTELPAPKNAR